MSDKALKDLKVCDFMWVMAGPAATRVLADFGATVVRVESTSRPDPARGVGPFLHDVIAPESSLLWNNNNAGKLGLGLDLSKASASRVVHDLIRWADVVADSFAPGTMDRLGFGYDDMCKINPSLIMVSTCLMGQYGDHSALAGFGNLSAAITGFYGLCGWPGRAPAGPFGAYTDYIAPRYVAAAILAAISRRERTGQGEYIDLAQSEAALHFLAPALLDSNLNGVVAEACGNDDPAYAPHGVYPCLGDDAWIAIACRTEGHWHSLCQAMRRDNLREDPRFSEFSRRQSNRDALYGEIAGWTGTMKPDEAERVLQAVNVPSSVVQNSLECTNDEQLLHRGHFASVEHSTLGNVVLEGPRFRLSRTPGEVKRAAPLTGEHTQLVLGEILGYEQTLINELYDSGAVV